MVHLPVKVKFTQNIQPIDLPKTCDEPKNADVVAVGHGKTSDDSDVSLQLNYALLTTLPSNLCRKVFPILSGRKSVICAISTEKDFQSVCGGDSGGPLITLSEPTLIGVSDFVRMGKIILNEFLVHLISENLSLLKNRGM